VASASSAAIVALLRVGL